jgi:GAF domain-containing protein
MQMNETRENTISRWLPVWLRGSKSPWVIGAGLYMIAYSAWIVLKWTDPAYESIIANLGYLPLSFFSAVSGFYVSRQPQLEQRTRLAWQFIAASLLSLAVGDILYTILDITKGVGFPDLPDFFYLAFYPLAFIGLITIPSQVSDQTEGKTWRIDLVIIMTSATAILWYFIIAPTAVAGGDDWLSRLVAGAYPAMDMLLLASIAGLLFRRNDANTRESLIILGLGLMIYIAADLVYAWQVLQETYVSGSLVDILWILSYFLIALSALRQASTHLISQDTGDKPGIVWQITILPMLALGASVITSLLVAASGEMAGLPAYGLYIGTVITIFVTIARQLLITRENSRLIDELNSATEQLRANNVVLEQRVVERTSELTDQTNRLRLVAQAAREITSATSLDNLLNLSTTLILDRFNLYHAAIFLLDTNREFASLVASPTEAGRQMIASGQKFGVGSTSIVGRVAATGEPRIALDADLEAVQFNNPLLPASRSEMALPLKVENRTIGVLDVHSDRPRAFNEDDIAIMQVLADQLGVAIERANLLQRVEENLLEIQRASGAATRESWRSVAESGLLSNAGYRFDNVRIQPANSTHELGTKALQTGRTVVQRENGRDQSEQALAAIPVKLRGQPIGVVTVKLKEGYNSNTISTIEQAVERLATSLESARLFEEARLRADREQAISQVTAAISSASEFDAILRTTVEEIGRSFGDSEVSIQLTEHLE